MNPNDIINQVTRACSSEDLLQEYVGWAVDNYPGRLIITAAVSRVTPRLRDVRIVRGVRQDTTGWCVVESTDFPDSILILRKENINK